ncbi:hypothetical protein DPX16_22144 [Anabarilius grahami]|uniref:Uncharacterized protein n=1 Tax=Anabarilius grahami TaxID=495550 RepID=A0A3N0XR17_ANAGA|nr:hypothetical protein DPX16_22144 [Anabarilius grahami]
MDVSRAVAIFLGALWSDRSRYRFSSRREHMNRPHTPVFARTSLPSSSSSCSASLLQNLPFSLSEGSHWLLYVCVRVCKSVSESAQPSLDDRGPRTVQTTHTPAFSPPPEQLRKRHSPEKEQQKSQIESKRLLH